MQFLEREKKLFLKRKENEIKNLTTSFDRIGFLFEDQKGGFKIVPLNRLKFALQSNKSLLIFSLLMLLLSFGFVFLNASIVYFFIVFLAFMSFGLFAFWRIRKLLAFEINLTGDRFTFKIGKQKIELKRNVIVETYIDEVDTDTIKSSTRCWDFNVEKNDLSESKLVNLFTLSDIGNGESFLVRNFCVYLMICSNVEVEFVERK